jgi:dynein heavy chain, axonemal
LKRMDSWEKIIPQFKYNKDVPFFEMLVPTVDTVRYGYLLEKLLAVKQSVLYTGNTGVGKVRTCQTNELSHVLAASFARQ